MAFELVKWVYWIVGGIGVIGVIALWLLAPAVAGAILRAVVAIISELLSTRLGCAIIAAIVVGLAVNLMRASIDERQFAERTAAFEEMQKKRDEQIAADARETALKEQAEIDKANATTDSAVKDFTNDLPQVPSTTSVPGIPVANTFLVGDDTCRLRIIAGLTPCGSDRSQGVRKAGAKAASSGHHTIKRLPNARSTDPRTAQ